MNETKLETRPTPVFDLTGGYLCLDFANTLENRMGEKPLELLSSYHDLVAWGEQTEIVSNKEGGELREEAARRPTEAAAVRARGLALREALYGVFVRLVEGGAPEPSHLLILNEVLAEGMAQARLVAEGEDFRWDWSAKGGTLESILWMVARSAAELLTSALRHDLRLCAADDCGWLFLDTSKNHSRRWCNMKSCGNRAKARRYIERKR